MVAPVTQGPPQANQADTQLAPQALQAMQQFVQALRSDPQTAPLVATLGALLQSSPDMPRKLVGLLMDQGPQVLLQLLQQAAQQGVGQGGGQPAPPQAAPPPPPAPPRNDGPPPPGAMAPPQQGPPPPPQPPPPPPQDPQAREHLLAELRPELSRVFRALNPDQQAQVLGLFAQRGIGAVEGLLGQLLAARQQTGPGVPSNAPGRKRDGPDYPGAQKPKKKRSKATPAFELRPRRLADLRARPG
jgi:hypothetical protein